MIDQVDFSIIDICASRFAHSKVTKYHLFPTYTSVLPITFGWLVLSLLIRVMTAYGSDVPLRAPATLESLVALTDSWTFMILLFCNE